MASYQARGRDPLFDSKTQAALEKRSKELIGVGFIVISFLFSLLLGSYTPEDPSWLSSTSEPAQNTLGRFGASIASPLMVIFDIASWGIPLYFAAWGIRFILHRGSTRVLSRSVFAPISIALIAVYAATHSSSAPQSFGGLFGDTLLAALIQIVPLGAALSLKLLSFGLFFASIALFLYVLGFTKEELSKITRFAILGLVALYAFILELFGKGARKSVQLSQDFSQKREESRQRAAEMAAYQEQIQNEQQHYEQSPAASRIMRQESFLPDERQIDEQHFNLVDEDDHTLSYDDLPEHAEIEQQPVQHPVEPPSQDDKMRSRITKAINARLRLGAHGNLGDLTRVEPPLTAAQKAAAKYKKGQAPILYAKKDEPPSAQEQAHQMHDDFEMEPAAPFAPDIPSFETAEAPMEMAALESVNYHDEAQANDDYSIEEPEYVAHQQERYVPEAPLIPEAKAVVQHRATKPITPSKQAKSEAQPSLKFDPTEAQYETPPLSLLDNPVHIERHTLSDEALEENARMLENVLDDYGVKGEIVSVRPGPVVTMYELEPAPGLKASRVIGLADDIARSMSALSARVSTVPGRSVIGIELPNENRETVGFREILSTRDYGDGKHALPLALGKDIGGESVVANLAKMPHLLIAGTTGSGKSVAINTMILSLLYKLTPAECRLIMIDPKMLELSVYDGIPHLLSPVVTDPKKAVVALKWVVAEMEDRYRKMSKMGVRNVDGYNGRVKEALAKNEMFSRTVQTGFDEETGDPIFETEEFQPEILPFIVVIVDEMADLMMVAGKEIEACIQRLAQMARASGIHIIMATQRPSVDVITGTIKANFPTRISFQVTSKIDSRTILGEQGAEQLLGMGDMLYMAGGGRIQRCHAPFVTDEEVEKVVTYLKDYGPPDYVGGVVEGPDDEKSASIDAVLGLNTGGNTGGEDVLYDQAVAIVLKDRKCSTSYIQRKLSIGYNKAAKLVEQMEDQGVVSPANHVGKREILVPEQ